MSVFPSSWNFHRFGAVSPQWWFKSPSDTGFVPTILHVAERINRRVDLGGTSPDAFRHSAQLLFHGGGYVFGHIDLFDGPVSRYVSASGVPILSVEYRRVPEHPFPTPLEDACTALRWLHDNASPLGVDRVRVLRSI